MFKKIIAVVATVTMMVLGFTVAPASATAYSANANSTANQLRFSGIQEANGDFSVPVPGIKSTRLFQRWVWKGTKLSDVLNKTVKVNLTLTRTGGQAQTNVVSSESFSYYEYAVLFLTNDGGQDMPAQLAVGDTEVDIIPVSGHNYDRLHIDIYSNLQNPDGSDLAVGTYRLTYQVLVDGVPYSNFAATPANDTAYFDGNYVVADQPWAVTKDREVQYGLYDTVTSATKTCLNPALITAGDVLTARRLVDGVEGASTATNSSQIYVNGSYYNWSNPTASFTATSAMTQYQTAFFAEPLLYKPTSTNQSAVAANKLATGNHTIEISVTKADGTEVSGPCLVSATSTPTATINGSSLSASIAGYSETWKMACQAYDATTNAAVGDLTPVPGYSSFSNIMCNPTGVPTGRPVYVKFVTWNSAFPDWKSYSAASNNVTVPAVGVTLTSTASNGTAFGQVKTPLALDELNVGSGRVTNAQVSDPSGALWDIAANSNNASNTTDILARRITATGVDSNYATISLSVAGSSVTVSSGWHGTLVSPRLVIASYDPGSNTALRIKDFNTSGVAGNTRDISQADLNALCTGSGGFGAGYSLSSMNRVGAIISAPTAGVYMQLACSLAPQGQTPMKTGYLLVNLDLAGTSAPTIVTNFGTPTNALPDFSITGSMSGMTGVHQSVNVAASGSAPMFTFVSMPQYQNWSGMTPSYSYESPKIYRVTAGGVVSISDSGITVPAAGGSSQLNVDLVSENFGVAVLQATTMSSGQQANSPTTTFYKIGSTGTASVLNLNWDSTTDFPSQGAGQDYLQGLVGVTASGDLVIVRWRALWSMSQSSANIALAKLNLSTGAVNTFGEKISHNQTGFNGFSNLVALGGNSAAYIAQDATNPGKLIFATINGGEVPSSGGNGGGSNTVPSITGDGTAELGKSLNIGGTTFTLAGSLLNLVTEVWVGGVKATIKTKANGTITVQVPAGSSATAPIVFKYNGGEIPAGVWNYVGATKVSQTLTFSAGGALANYAEPDRTLAATAENSTTHSALSVQITYSTTTPKVCTILNGNKLHFVAAGTCVVKASQPGSTWLTKAADVSSTVTVVKASQTWTTTPASTLSITDATPGRIVAVLNNNESVIDFTSQTPLICEVDSDGNVTGLVAGTCTVLVSQAGDTRYSAVTPVTVTVTVTADTSPIADFADEETDTGVAKAIPSGAAGTFVATNDPSFQLSWNSATGKLIPRATGVYLGNINAKVEFTRGGVNYVCVMTFGNLTKMPVKTAAQKKAAKAGKIFTTKTAFCYDAKKLSVPASLDGKANFAKLKSIAKTAADKASEKAAATALKGFTGNATITVTRYRTWWSTMLNVTGDKGNGKKIKATKRVTVVALG